MCVPAFATDSNAEEEAPPSAVLFQSDTDEEEFNGFRDLK